MFYQKITYQIERAKLVGEPVILMGDFNAKLGRNLKKSDIHDMRKMKSSYMSYTTPVLNLSL